MTESYKQCLQCRTEQESEDLFTLYLHGVFVDLCKPCLAKVTKESLSKLIESDDSFLKRKLQSSRYLQCPVCHSSKVENEFVVMIVEDSSLPMGVDGFAVCRGCFKDKFEKPEMTEKEITKTVAKREVTTADISTTAHMENLEEYHTLLDELAPKLKTDRFECGVCKQVYLPLDMAYVIAYEVVEDEDGVKTVKHSSGKVCLECYRKLWGVTANRGMRGSVHGILQTALVKLTIT